MVKTNSAPWIFKIFKRMQPASNFWLNFGPVRPSLFYTIGICLNIKCKNRLMGNPTRNLRENRLAVNNWNLTSKPSCNITNNRITEDANKGKGRRKPINFCNKFNIAQKGFEFTLNTDLIYFTNKGSFKKIESIHTVCQGLWPS